MALGCVATAAGYIMMLATNSNAVRYAGTFVIAVGVYPNSALIMVRSLVRWSNGPN